ncbi:hypothetical protein, partial [Bacteroides fragilis]|uniref:hypothetical protein n=1 Tax=Bacteroides fragilis TaxID=817 RepID=UPI0012D496E2
GVASPVYKLMYLGSSTREINEGVSRIDRILENQPVSEPACPKIPATYDSGFTKIIHAGQIILKCMINVFSRRDCHFYQNSIRIRTCSKTSPCKAI